jgi:uncharacterized protein YjdB
MERTLMKAQSIAKISFTLGLLLVAIVATSCGGHAGSQGSSGSTGSTPTMTSLQVAPGSPSIATGATQQFTATAHYSDNSTKDVSATAQWSSSNSSVASVNSAGLASGAAAGSVTITAQSGAFQGNATLKVTSSGPPSLTSVQVSPGSASVGAGATQQFTATAHYSDNSAQDVTASAQWSSSDSNIASVNSAGLASGATAGSVTITAQSGGLQGAASLKVTSAANSLQSIAILPASSSMPVNTNVQFTATGSYSDGSSADLTNLVTWNSSSPATATVSSAGVVSSLAAGATNISATLGSVSQSTSLTVTAPTVASIAVTPVGLTLPIGIHQQFVATATYTDGTSADLSAGVTWSSSATSVVTVDGSGLGTTVAAGSANVTATLGALTDTVSVTVVPAHLVSISVSPASPSVALGTGGQFVATGNFDDGSFQILPSVSWSSSVSSVATVDANGFATSVGTGTTTITATSGSVSGNAALTVTSATLVSIAVTPTNSNMAVGTTKQFSAMGSFSDSSTQDVSASVVWSSSSPAVATINSTGVVQSVASGSATITATFGSVSGSTSLTVSTAHLVSIAITPANPRIAAHTSIKLTATGTFSDGSTSNNLAGLTWKSSKPSVANMRGSGIAHGKKGGSATISASASGVKGTTTLTVGTGTLVSLAITPANVTDSVGCAQQFTATGTFSDGGSQDMTLNAHWSSSVASVGVIANAPSVAGQAQCLATGATVIGANSHGTTGSANLTVQ